MRDDEKWPLVHAYRTAAANDLVPHINCPECEHTMVTVADLDSDPAFKCMSGCGTFGITIQTYEAMKKNLKELNDRNS
jgi:hypothetical protein